MRYVVERKRYRQLFYPSSCIQARQREAEAQIQRDLERLNALKSGKKPAASVKSEGQEGTKRIKVEVKAEEVDGKMIYEIEDDD